MAILTYSSLKTLPRNQKTGYPREALMHNQAMFRSLILLFIFCPLSYAQNFCDDLLNKDLKATLQSFELMRGSSGLVQDTIWTTPANDGRLIVSSINPNTSLTNIAVDLLVQAELKNLRVLRQAVEVLESLSFHRDSGLFYSWYSTTLPPIAKDKAVSSIDNLHLALALWTLKENFPGTSFGKTARFLFERMNFSVFYDADSGLIGGNLRFNGEKWIREEYNFSHFGSEARLLYSVGWALGLFKNYSQEKDFIEKAFKQMQIETEESTHGALLKLWDGALFQLYFPKIFINEELYSTEMRGFYDSAARLIIAEGHRRGLEIPAAHSPGRSDSMTYKDKSGIKRLISSHNRDVDNEPLFLSWENLVTPHALFMAATTNPEVFAAAISAARSIRLEDRAFYHRDMGWMDALVLKQNSEPDIIPAQLSLNQGMIALSILQMSHPTGLSLSSRSLFQNPEIRKRLQIFYKLLDEALEGR